jgi:protease-4
MLSRSLFLPALAPVFLFATAPVLQAAEPKVATAAHIKLAGSMEEGPVADDPLFGGGVENFKAKLDRIKKAKDDTAVQGLVLHLAGIEASWGKLDELRRAVADFRKTGKKAFAFVEAGDIADYLLALACDEVCMPEPGWLMLTGLRAEATFYKDLLDHLGVKADMLQMGDFKGAAEPFTRDRMSPEFRKQFESVLDDLYEKSVVEVIVQGRPNRKWNAEQVRQFIDRGPYTARAALAAGLIDRVAYADQFQASLKSSLGADELKIAKNYGQAKKDEIDFSNPLTALMKLLATPKPTVSTRPKVAVIYATGVINTGKSSANPLTGDSVGSTTLIEAIRQAEEDKTVHAIVLRVDSPGGSALASDLIWNELNRCKKPVIASMGDTAASGGYYISMAAQRIYAEPGTLTGSIGVVGGKMVLSGLYDKVGIKTEIISRGANSGILSSTTPFSDSERTAITALMKDTYEQFLNKALAGRKKAGRAMTPSDLEKLAGGRIWTGRQARAHGLVDELGTLDDAIRVARDLGGMDRDTMPELLLLPKPRSLLDSLLERDASAEMPGLHLRQLPVLRELPEMTRHLGRVEGLLRLHGEPVWVIVPYHVRVK